jgi:hypothetical protein
MKWGQANKTRDDKSNQYNEEGEKLHEDDLKIWGKFTLKRYVTSWSHHWSVAHMTERERIVLSHISTSCYSVVASTAVPQL